MDRPRFGLELCSQRYSAPNHLKGNKLSVSSTNRTMKLKLRKIEEIRSARSELQLYIPKREDAAPEAHRKEFLKTHSRPLRTGYAEPRKVDFEGNQLFVEPDCKKQEVAVERPKPFYHSDNLQEKMNLYLNNLINQSEEQHRIKLREFQQKIEEELPARRTSFNPRNPFWKQMKRAASYRKGPSPRLQGLFSSRSDYSHILP